jgi:hypothetical protein
VTFPHPDEIMAIHASLNGDFSQRAVADAVATYYGNQPHPAAPQIKVKDYPAYERVAWMMNDVQPKGADVAHAAESLNQAGVSPSEFEQFWTTARPVANRLLGRDPSLIEAQRLKDATPQDIHRHYMDHPYPGYEEVTAGQMAKYYRAAEPIARQYGRVPNHEEVSRFAIAGYEAEHMDSHYQGGG